MSEYVCTRNNGTKIQDIDIISQSGCEQYWELTQQRKTKIYVESRGKLIETGGLCHPNEVDTLQKK